MPIINQSFKVFATITVQRGGNVFHIIKAAADCVWMDKFSLLVDDYVITSPPLELMWDEKKRLIEAIHEAARKEGEPI